MRFDGTTKRSPLVLLVDDEPLVASTLSDVLRHSGCEVVTFVSGTDVMAYAPECAPDVVVTDFAMQPVDGLRLAAWVRQAYPNARILMITADGHLVQREAGRRLPFRVMEKPLSSAALIAAVYDEAESANAVKPA